MQLYLKTPPAQEPVSLEEVKTYLRISSDQEDRLLNTLIASSRAYVEKITGRALLKQGWVMHLTPPYPPSFPLVKNERSDLEITLPLPPLLKVEFVKTGKKDVPYTAQENKVTLSPHFWGKSFSIFFWAGYGEETTSLPSDLKLSVLMAARFLYEGQKPVLPLLGSYKVLRLI